MHNAILVLHNSSAQWCIGCRLPYWWCTIGLHQCAPSVQCHIGDAQRSCYIVHRVHNDTLVVQNGCAPLWTGCAMPHWWCTMVVHNGALGAQCIIGGAHWSSTIVHRVHNAILGVHNGHATLCTACTMTYWWSRMVVHHCAYAAQCHIGSAQWGCTIVHKVHDAILVLHNGRLSLRTGCETKYWWCRLAIHHCALDATRNIGGAQWSRTIVHNRAPGARCYIGGAQWLSTMVHQVQNAMWVVHNGCAPLCMGCAMSHW